jgi:hypothetical protein
MGNALDSNPKISNQQNPEAIQTYLLANVFRRVAHDVSHQVPSGPDRRSSMATVVVSANTDHPCDVEPTTPRRCQISI